MIDRKRLIRFGLLLVFISSSTCSESKRQLTSNNEQSQLLADTPEFAVTAAKTQEYPDIASLLTNIRGSSLDTSNPSPALAALLAAKRTENTGSTDTSKSPVGTTLTASDLAALLGKRLPTSGSNQQIDATTLLDNKNPDTSQPAKENNLQNDAATQGLLGGEDPSGKDEGKRRSHFTLGKGPDGSLVLVPVAEEAAASRALETPGMGPKNPQETKGNNRQTMQVTTLAQALYSPFPTDQNILHLHLKGKDGKLGKQGQRGPNGPPGAAGAAGPKGPKGDAGTCTNQLNTLYTCTPEELDSLASRVDYLEKICRKKMPPPPFHPQGSAGGEGNPMPSCQAVYEKDPSSKSGAYWLMVNGLKFKTYCDFDTLGKRGWTLVARINGTANDFTAVSNTWADNSVILAESAWDLSLRSTMKSHGWFLLTNNAIKVCYDGPTKNCAVFTHSLGMNLAELFSNEFGIIVEERWKFDPLLDSFGKSCNTKKMVKQWCGLNLANICHPEDINPNLNPTNHVVRIGCIGSYARSCTPADFSIGLGVTSCFDGYGCGRVGPRTPSMHWACSPYYGAFDQTAFLYIN